MFIISSIILINENKSVIIIIIIIGYSVTPRSQTVGILGH